MAVFKSSKVSIWPLFLVINELPYKKRMAKENMIFADLWFGDKNLPWQPLSNPFTMNFSCLTKVLAKIF